MIKSGVLSTIILLVWTFINCGNSNGQTYSQNGMVVSDNAVASEVGTNVLKKGGNAIDASIAAAFALAVTHPQAGNIGGGGFLVYLDSSGNSTTIDFREKAPLLATSDMFLDQNGQLIKGSNHSGLKSVGFPGIVAGFYLAHEKYGSLSWKELVQPSIDLAENGVILSWTLAKHAKNIHSSSASEFMKNYFNNSNGNLTLAGELWVQSELANTLKLIRDHGKDGFYRGAVAEDIDVFRS